MKTESLTEHTVRLTSPSKYDIAGVRREFPIEHEASHRPNTSYNILRRQTNMNTRDVRAVAGEAIEMIVDDYKHVDPR